MSKKKTYQQNKKDNAYKESYDLHTDAIDDLVNANADNTQEVPSEELEKYKRDWLSKIPVWIKALFIKLWFNGAVCFFFVWGLSMYIHGWDLIIVTGIAMGLVTDLLVNNLFHFFGDEKYESWMLIPLRGFWTLFANIGCSLVIMIAVLYFYYGVNSLLSTGDNIALGVEPITFGLIYLTVDLIFIGMRNLVKRIIADANKKLDQ